MVIKNVNRARIRRNWPVSSVATAAVFVDFLCCCCRMLEKAKYLHLSSAQVLKQFKRAGRHEKRTKKAQNGKYETV